MPDKFLHERLHRGAESIQLLSAVNVTLCGAGALGSNLADNLVRQGFDSLRVIDNDRVEQQNISTQLYGEEDVGALKTDVLANRLFRGVGVEITTINKRLDDRNARKLLKGSDIVIDAFDNSASRAIVQEHCRRNDITCLHAGLFEGYGEVVWDDQYRVPDDEVGEDVCEYALARNIVLMTVAVATESIIRFVLDGVHESWTMTLSDFGVHALAARVSADG